MSRPIYAEPGSSLAQSGGTCPPGWIVMQGERPSPDHVAGSDGTWQLPAPDYPALIAARRWLAETGGIEFGGMRVETDDRSKLLINGSATRATRDTGYVLRWKTPEGFVDLPAAQVLLVADAVADHVQACFDREAELLEALAAGEFSEALLDEGWPAQAVHP